MENFGDLSAGVCVLDLQGVSTEVVAEATAGTSTRVKERLLRIRIILNVFVMQLGDFDEI